jgi:hypothetical protein
VRAQVNRGSPIRPFRGQSAQLKSGAGLPISVNQGQGPNLLPMNNTGYIFELCRIRGQTVYLYKAPVPHLQGVFWCFRLADREPVEGFRTRKAAIAYAQRSLAF